MSCSFTMAPGTAKAPPSWPPPPRLRPVGLRGKAAEEQEQQSTQAEPPSPPRPRRRSGDKPAPPATTAGSAGEMASSSGGAGASAGSGEKREKKKRQIALSASSTDTSLVLSPLRYNLADDSDTPGTSSAQSPSVQTPPTIDTAIGSDVLTVDLDDVAACQNTTGISDPMALINSTGAGSASLFASSPNSGSPVVQASEAAEVSVRTLQSEDPGRGPEVTPESVPESVEADKVDITTGGGKLCSKWGYEMAAWAAEWFAAEAMACTGEHQVHELSFAGVVEQSGIADDTHETSFRIERASDFINTSECNDRSNLRAGTKLLPEEVCVAVLGPDGSETVYAPSDARRHFGHERVVRPFANAVSGYHQAAAGARRSGDVAREALSGLCQNANQEQQVCCARAPCAVVATLEAPVPTTRQAASPVRCLMSQSRTPGFPASSSTILRQRSRSFEPSPARHSEEVQSGTPRSFEPVLMCRAEESRSRAPRSFEPVPVRSSGMQRSPLAMPRSFEPVPVHGRALVGTQYGMQQGSQHGTQRCLDDAFGAPRSFERVEVRCSDDRRSAPRSFEPCPTQCVEEVGGPVRSFEPLPVRQEQSQKAPHSLESVHLGENMRGLVRSFEPLPVRKEQSHRAPRSFEPVHLGEDMRGRVHSFEPLPSAPLGEDTRGRIRSFEPRPVRPEQPQVVQRLLFTPGGSYRQWNCGPSRSSPSALGRALHTVHPNQCTNAFVSGPRSLSPVRSFTKLPSTSRAHSFDDCEQRRAACWVEDMEISPPHGWRRAGPSRLSETTLFLPSDIIQDALNKENWQPNTRNPMHQQPPFSSLAAGRTGLRECQKAPCLFQGAVSPETRCRPNNWMVASTGPKAPIPLQTSIPARELPVLSRLVHKNGWAHLGA